MKAAENLKYLLLEFPVNACDHFEYSDGRLPAMAIDLAMSQTRIATAAALLRGFHS